MIRCLFTLFLSLSLLGTYAQALRDINYSYHYQPDLGFDFQMKPVRNNTQWKIIYQLQLKDTTSINAYSIQWEARESMGSKEPLPLQFEIQNDKQTSSQSGVLTITSTTAPQIVVARIVNSRTNTAWTYFKVLENNYPVNNFLQGNGAQTKLYVKTGESLTLNNKSRTIVSYYNDKFPAAAPGFSETQGKVSKGMKSDSTLIIEGDSFQFFKDGLYLFQTDTLSAEGFAVRAESDYPRYSNVRNLPGPLIYICSKQEYDRLENANGNKKSFDNTVLTITGDVDRAKKLIKNYFRRVELANEYFTSYKEGWKTDRGMIYIIFGLPDEVYKMYDREIWRYKNDAFNVKFEFVKASSIFDPDNYVLIRDNKYKQTWYDVVDLWRNARF